MVIMMSEVTGVVEAISVENKGVMIDSNWYNWSKFSKTLSEDGIKMILSRLEKGTTVKLLGVNKNFFDSLTVEDSEEGGKQVLKQDFPKKIDDSVFNSLKLTSENKEDFKKKALLICEVADTVITFFRNNYGDGYDESISACLKYLFWGR